MSEFESYFKFSCFFFCFFYLMLQRLLSKWFKSQVKALNVVFVLNCQFIIVSYIKLKMSIMSQLFLLHIKAINTW